MDTQITLIAITVLGALIAAVLGWLESGDAFNPRKFSSSILRAIFAGFVAALIFEGQTEATIFTYLSAFLIGAGIDVTGHRLAGTLNQARASA